MDTLYIARFVPDADSAFEQLRHELPWERRDSTPRCEHYSNDTDVPYTYGAGAGIRTYQPQPWHPVTLDIRAMLETMLGVTFDVCFTNLYLNQRDWLGWHADDSPEMDPDRPIVSVSLGAERDIATRVTAQPDQVTVQRLGHGSAFIMPAGYQRTHQHRIPKAGYVTGERISLTYRGYLPANTTA
jgi:alkylated DNA repair dioxygenase AlkB